MSRLSEAINKSGKNKEPQTEQIEFLTMELESLVDQPSELAELDPKHIDTGDRARREVGDPAEWMELKESIKQQGIISPIAVMRIPEEELPHPRGCLYRLLAGGRRLMCANELRLVTVPAKIFPTLDSHRQALIELQENTHRMDFSPVDRMMLVKKVHELYVQIYGERLSSAPLAPGHSMRDTAKMMGISPATASRDLRTASILSALSEEQLTALSKKVKTKADVVRLLEQAKKEVKKDAALEEFREKEKQHLTNLSSTPSEKTAKVDPEEQKILLAKKALISQYNVGDAIAYLKQQQDNTFSFFNFDPDYPVEIDEDSPSHELHKRQLAEGSYHKIPKDEYMIFVSAVAREAYRVAKVNAWIIVWFGWEFFGPILQAFTDAGWDTSFLPGFWFKNTGHTSVPKRYLHKTVEPFFYFRKGLAQIQQSNIDVLQFPPVFHKQRINQYEKPIELYEKLFEIYTFPGITCLDICTGSGNMLLASSNKERKTYGIDLSAQQKESFSLHVVAGQLGQFTHKTR